MVMTRIQSWKFSDEKHEFNNSGLIINAKFQVRTHHEEHICVNYTI